MTLPAIVEDPDAVLGRFWEEIRRQPALSHLVGLVPADRKLGMSDAIWLLPSVMTMLGQPADQLRLLDALGHAYARARGLHFAEE